MDYLPIQASAVPCERVFSSSKETDTKKRNRINPMLMEALQMVKFILKKERLNFTSGWMTSEANMTKKSMAGTQDLLEQFLAKQNYKLVWITWGERQHSIDMMSNLSPAYRPGQGEPPWRVFQQVTPYDKFKGTHDL